MERFNKGMNKLSHKMESAAIGLGQGLRRIGEKSVSVPEELAPPETLETVPSFVNRGTILNPLTLLSITLTSVLPLTLPPITLVSSCLLLTNDRTRRKAPSISDHASSWSANPGCPPWPAEFPAQGSSFK